MQTRRLFAPGARRVAVHLAVVAMAASVVGATSWGAAAAGVAGVDRFVGDRGQSVELTIPADQLGLVLGERGSDAALRQAVQQRGWKVLKRWSPAIYTVALDQPLSRPALVLAARQFAADNALVVKAAGLASTERTGGPPRVVTDNLVVKFRGGLSAADRAAAIADAGATSVRPLHYLPDAYVLKVTPASGLDSLQASGRLQGSGMAELVHPDLYDVQQTWDTTPADPLFGQQWHHRNDGTDGCVTSGGSTVCGGTVDADADTSKAWDFGFGATGSKIAVMDDGTQFTHPDLSPNLQTNGGETAGNGIDDDGNGFVDDVNGWDFVGLDNNPGPSGGEGNHGTATAGVAVADNNGIGGDGACPDCRFVSIKICCGGATSDIADAFGYATDRGADILTNSWSYPQGVSVPTVVATGIHGATAAGRAVFFAAANDPTAEYCVNGIQSLTDVIVVSGSSNTDRKIAGQAWGNCVDLLAPTRFEFDEPSVPIGDAAYAGQLSGFRGILTTDRTGSSGYNTASPNNCPAVGIANVADQDYTNCFGGSSSATPLAAGVAGLAEALRPSMTGLQLQRLLQDTTDRNEDSLGAYSKAFGYSRPASGTATHAWGRLNAFEAARVVAPTASGGHGGVDVFLRDNRLDWGNTEQPSNHTFEPTPGYLGHWKSVDIKVDSEPFQPAPTTHAQFEALDDEQPHTGHPAKVYLRVRNRGPVTASSVTAKVHWTQFGTSLATLAPDFWSAFPADPASPGEWNTIDSAKTLTSLAYSGPSVAGCPSRPAPDCAGGADAAQVAAFDWLPPALDPAKPNHFCLFAVISSPQDDVSAASKSLFTPDDITPNDNNVTHRNITIGEPDGAGMDQKFMVRNPYRETIRTLVRTDGLPKGWTASLSPVPFDQAFTLKPGEQKLLELKVWRPDPGPEEFDVSQLRLTGSTNAGVVIGGFTVRFPEKK